ncbi:MAG TPA: Hpt domain-containing protein [bacterium]|nr:Hpt domain-containing protein [bacterium]HPO07795.1 Hpt domain-containing protein [bacterium]HQO34345.1 Hpt domain-containing protein [bacterium]HQP97898.1 Hpt domain-containing protein [bacterium]
MNNETCIDPTALERIRGIGGDDLLTKMIALFIQNVEKRLREASEGKAAGDSEAVGRAAHSIKSSSGNVGAVRLQRIAQEIERLAMEGNIRRATDRIAELEGAFSEVKAHLTGKGEPSER